MHKTSRNERRLLVNNTRDINSSKVEAVILVINHHCRVSCNHQSRIDIAYLLALNRRRKTELSVRRMLCVVLVGTGRTCTGTAVVVVVHLCWLRLSFVCHHSLSRCNLRNSTFPISLSIVRSVLSGLYFFFFFFFFFFLLRLLRLRRRLLFPIPNPTSIIRMRRIILQSVSSLSKRR